jgi:hypothetical protein
VVDYAFDCPDLTIVCSEGSYIHQYCIQNSLPFIFDYQYKAYGGLLPPGFKKLASPFLADEEKPFVFVSYSHKDRDEVLGIIKTLYESGWKIWYDEGLTIGDRYDETLENHVRDCSAFLLFVTRNSLNSVYCRENEIPWAIQYGKPIIRCILDEGVEYPIREDAVAATVLPAEAASALAKIDGLTKGEQRIATGISVVVNPGDRDESDHEGKEEGFAYCLHADQNTAVIKAIQLEAKNSGCSLYDASEEGEEREKLQNSACLVVFLDKAFLADEHLTDILIKEYQAGKDLAICMIESIEDSDLPEELIGLHKMQWLNYAFGISNDMNTKLFRHLQKRGCRNTAVLPGYEYRRTDSGIIIEKYTGLDPNPRIESEYGGVPVIAISREAFYNNRRIKSVMISEGITEIGNRAFANCASLTSIIIPNSVNNIGDYAFSGCIGLTSIIIPDSVREIGYSAFGDCNNLALSVFPNGVTKIGNWVRLIKQTSIIIPDSITIIGSEAFKGCTELTSIVIPDSVIRIDSSAFSECTNLNSINIPESVTKIGSEAFKGCIGLTSIVIPDSVTEISSSAFSECSNLNSINIPDSVTKIGSEAFKRCTGLTSINIPDSVTEIGKSAFEWCKGLTSVCISGSITKIDKSLFEGCTNLSSIEIPDSVTEICRDAFKGCSCLASVIIPDSVCDFHVSVFEKCPNLTVTCSPDSVAWKYCKSLGIHVLAAENSCTAFCSGPVTRNHSEKSEASIPATGSRVKALIKKMLFRTDIEPKDAKPETKVFRTDVKPKHTKPKPYEGWNKYAFVSYCHHDSEIVNDMIIALQNKGFRLWFDSGMPFEQFPAETAGKIEDCEVFLCLLSTDYQESEYCMREFHYAYSQTRKIFPVFLTEFRISESLEFQLECAMKPVSLYRYDSIDEFADNMERWCGDILDPCRQGNTEE